MIEIIGNALFTDEGQCKDNRFILEDKADILALSASNSRVNTMCNYLGTVEINVITLGLTSINAECSILNRFYSRKF